MNGLLFYMVKVAACLAGFYFVYFLFLRKDTMYSRNRAFILLSLISSLILPLINIQNDKLLDLHFFGKTLAEILVYGTKDGTSSAIPGESFPRGLQIIFGIYIIGLIITGLKLLYDLFELLITIVKEKKKGGSVIHFTGLDTAGFSAMGHVFINSKLSADEAAEVIKHEQNHITNNHFFDIIFIGLIKCFQWFNPFIHLFDRSLREVHEFQADEECLSSGVTVIRYQRLLLNQVFRSKVFGVTNSFSNPTLIKKRMIMMTKKRSHRMANLKLLMVLPVIAAMLLFSSACGEKKTTNATLGEVAPPPPPPPPPLAEGSKIVDETSNPDGVPKEVFQICEEMPKYPGGDKAMMDFVGKNVTYPETPKKKGIQGRVIVQFCVTYEGTIGQIKIKESVNPELDAEAIRIVKMMPKWTPGKQGGKVVNVWMYLPVNFKLN